MGKAGKALIQTPNDSTHQRADFATKRATGSRRFLWPVLTFCLIVCAGLLVAANKRAEFRADLKEDTGLVREQLARRFESVISDMVRPMRRFGRDILSGNISSPSNFQKSAESLQHEIHAYRKMWWLDASGVCVAASKNGEAQVGHRLSEQPGWENVRNAVESRTDSYAMLEPGQDRPRLVAVIPVRPDNTDQIVGFIVARLDIRDVLEKVIDEHTIDRFNIELRDPSGNISLPARVNVPEPKDFSTDEPIKVLGATWHLAVWPLEKFISHKPQGEQWMAIWGSVVLGIVAARVVWQELEHRRRDRAYQSALEALGKMTGAIAAAPESGRQVLRQVTQIAADLLQMPICVFSLWDESEQRFDVIYSQAEGEPLIDIREHYSLDDLPATRKAFAISAPVYASDILRNPECFDQEAAIQHRIRSTLIVPLQLDGQPVGMLALSHTRPRKFTKSDLKLASLWGAQAAVTVVNSELHRQTQRDAQAKVVLLRELNHRVKNNLASIAGLLCTSPVELPSQVRQWLDRVIERVSGMSRLHELLTDGMQSISVPDLVRKAVDSATLVVAAGGAAVARSARRTGVALHRSRGDPGDGVARADV